MEIVALTNPPYVGEPRCPLLSLVYNCRAMLSCFWLLMQITLCAIAFARERAVSNIPARIARIAMTGSNSINVKARFFQSLAERE